MMTITWCRAHNGWTSDHKWPLIARKSGQPVGIVVSVFAALFDFASQAEDRGSVASFDPEELDTRYGYEDGVTASIVKALEAKGVITAGRLANWEKRQPKREDDSTERTREWRGRKKQESAAQIPGNLTEVKQNERVALNNPPIDRVPVTQCDAPVTPVTQCDARIEKNRIEKKREKKISTMVHTSTSVPPPANLFSDSEKKSKSPPMQPEAWTRAQGLIRESVGESCFDTWFRPIACRGINNGVLELDVPTESFRKCLLENFKPKLLKATGAREIRIQRRGVG